MAQINSTKYFFLTIITLIIISVQLSFVSGELISPDNELYEVIKNEIQELISANNPIQAYNGWMISIPETININENAISIVLIESPQE